MLGSRDTCSSESSYANLLLQRGSICTPERTPLTSPKHKIIFQGQERGEEGGRTFRYDRLSMIGQLIRLGKNQSFCF